MSRQVTADQVIKALMRRPKLLFDVRQRMWDVRGCGPWMNTGKRFGNPDTRNVWGLPRFPKSKDEIKRFEGHPHDAASRVFVATVRPTEEWGKEVGQEHPGKWYWNVSTGKQVDNASGITGTRDEAKAEAEAYLEGHGWAVITG